MTFRLIVNFKMHEVSALLDEYSAFDVPMDVLVPYPYIEMANRKLAKTLLRVGAQNASEHDRGAYTGQVSFEMLKAFGVSLVMLGHQEVSEGVDLVAKKVKQAQAWGFDVVYCVGGSSKQLEQQLDGIEDLQGLALAYEPGDAIGSGKAAETEVIERNVLYIKDCIRKSFPSNQVEVPVLYGGSVNNKNCRNILEHARVDGLLIGSAALNVAVLTEVVNICKQY